MGQDDYDIPPDFQSQPFPNQPGIDPFSRQQQFIEAFATSSTADPFRIPDPMLEFTSSSTTQQPLSNFNSIQNNELGDAQRPLDPFRNSNDFGRRRNEGRSRLQVDEFGNPLGNYYFSEK